MNFSHAFRKLLTFFQAPPEFAQDFRQYRRAQLVNFFLLLLAFVLTVASIFNSLTVRFYLVSFIEVSLAAFCFGTYYRFRTRLDLASTGWIVSSIIGLITLSLIVYAKGQLDTYALAIFYPMVVYPLHGTRKGGFAHGIYSLAVLATLLYGWERWSFVTPLSSIFNVLIVLVMGGGVIYYYERTKEEALNRVHEAAMTDPLTGIWNRTMFDQILDREIADSRRYHTSFSLILSDLDHFKRVNDTYGHHIGDNVLKEYVTVIGERKRSSDHLSRWGGEEFALILPNTRLAEAETVAKALGEAVRHHRFRDIGGLTASMGVGEFNYLTNRDEFFKAIDNALYDAKQQGRNRYVIAGRPLVELPRPIKAQTLSRSALSVSDPSKVEETL